MVVVVVRVFRPVVVDCRPAGWLAGCGKHSR